MLEMESCSGLLHSRFTFKYSQLEIVDCFAIRLAVLPIRIAAIERRSLHIPVHFYKICSYNLLPSPVELSASVVVFLRRDIASAIKDLLSAVNDVFRKYSTRENRKVGLQE